ncbi:hypothetical protein [Chitinophaga varians]|uniref:hypothetical protein n=1 Tax=Chitinophaga varians TaxID=2202339 RepID=UPI00165F116F|nr:hypothetical protein [Chitinophaga varians]MBC9914983.1 hypothetical protein [Chitinophaga varians]
MTEARKQEIAASFPDTFDTNRLDIEISINEFGLFEKGFFARDMDEKWDIFVLDNILYFARSWTGLCVYRIFTQRLTSSVILSEFHLNRSVVQQNDFDPGFYTALLKKVLQMYLTREYFKP